MGSDPVRPHAFLGPLALWVLMAIVAVINGGLREALLIPAVGEYPGHVLSTAVLVLAIAILAYLYFTRSALERTRLELLLIGVTWTVLTVGFEFLVGYVEGTPVAVTIGQYDVLAGQVWILVPLTLLLAPLAFGWYLPRRRLND